MAEQAREKTTAADLIAKLQKLPPDAEVVTSIYGWEGPDLGPVSIVKAVEVVDDRGRHSSPTREHVADQEGRIVYLLDTPA